MQDIRDWIEGSPYGTALGVEVDELSDASARLVLPYQDDNSNPGQALHGGVVASTIVLAAHGVARGALGPDTAPWHTAAVQVVYLAAAIGEPIVAEARLLRRGKELCFLDVGVTTAEGKPVAQGLVQVRGRAGAPEVPAESLPRATPLGDEGADPGLIGANISRSPFIGNLGLRVEHMQHGVARLVMPFQERNADAGGGVHEGALLALLDTAGAMASISLAGPDRLRASTPSLQAQILSPLPATDLVARCRVVFRDRESFFSDVTIASTEAERLLARGMVNYRIVTKEA